MKPRRHAIQLDCGCHLYALVRRERHQRGPQKGQRNTWSDFCRVDVDNNCELRPNHQEIMNLEYEKLSEGA